MTVVPEKLSHDRLQSLDKHTTMVWIMNLEDFVRRQLDASLTETDSSLFPFIKTSRLTGKATKGIRRVKGISMYRFDDCCLKLAVPMREQHER